MGMFTELIKRSNTDEIRKEDDMTAVIKEFFENQKQVSSYDITRVELDFTVDVEGTIHIYKDEELGFKFGKVSGDIICHCRSIRPALIPAHLGGRIYFDVESIQPAQGQQDDASPNQSQQDDGFGGMELLTNKIPTESKIRKDLESLISDCVEYGYKIDIDSILKSLEAEKAVEDKYKLRIEYKYKYNISSNALTKCDIYISDDDEDILNLTAIEKAAYLAFLLYEDGIILGPITMEEGFVSIMKKIYAKLPDKVQDDVNGGLMTNKVLYAATLNGYRNIIRDAIKDRLKNKHLINKFAIEGYKEQPFKIQKSTPEIREQIKKIFNIE